MQKPNTKTQIEVKISTRDKLKKLRLVDRESYDSIINRLMKGTIRS